MSVVGHRLFKLPYRYRSRMLRQGGLSSLFLALQHPFLVHRIQVCLILLKTTDALSQVIHATNRPKFFLRLQLTIDGFFDHGILEIGVQVQKIDVDSLGTFGETPRSRRPVWLRSCHSFSTRRGSPLGEFQIPVPHSPSPRHRHSTGSYGNHTHTYVISSVSMYT